MNDVLNSVLADLSDAGDRLEGLVVDLDEAGWATPTPAAGWDVKHQVAHLAWTDEAALAAATDPAAWEGLVLAAMANPSGFVDEVAASGAAVGAEQLLARWTRSRVALVAALRAYPASAKMPWFGPPMSPTSMATARFMETWAHALDVTDALGATYLPTDAIRHVAHLGVRTRDFAFGVHELVPPAGEFLVELTAPSGAVWQWGPGDVDQTVRGSAYDFCLLVTQRRHRTDLDLVATGPDADRWLDIAQAFAGPSGAGREATAPPGNPGGSEGGGPA